MNRLGICLNRFALARKVPTNAPTSASTDHLRAGFDKLVSEYDRTGQLPDLSHLVCTCMKQGEVGVLREILAFKGMRSLCIKGPMEAQDWETLVNAVPDEFPVAALTLSNVVLDRLSVELLFKVLGKMPALANLVLNGVQAGAGVTDASECPALKQLKTLSVVEAGGGVSGGAADEAEAGVCPLLLKILEACQLRSLNIRGLRFEVPGRGNRKPKDPVVTVGQNESLGKAICGQFELRALRITNCRALVRGGGRYDVDLVQDSGHLVQITPAVYKMPSLGLLDLSGNSLPVSTTTSILIALRDSGTCLRHLYLNGNFMGHDTVAAMALLLGKNRTLLSVSFEHAKEPADGRERAYHFDEGDVEQLTEAVEHNTSLRRLKFLTWPWIDRSALTACLQRNIQHFRASYAVGGMHAFMNGAAGRHIPIDIARHASALGKLNEEDAWNLSSVNRPAWLWRQRVFAGEDPSK